MAPISCRKKLTIPAASPIEKAPTRKGEFASLVRAEIKDNRAVRRTVSLPKWLDEAASASGLSLSRVLQDALGEKLA
jgi:hypothetical protein